MRISVVLDTLVGAGVSSESCYWRRHGVDICTNLTRLIFSSGYYYTPSEKIQWTIVVPETDKNLKVNDRTRPSENARDPHRLYNQILAVVAGAASTTNPPRTLEERSRIICQGCNDSGIVSTSDAVFVLTDVLLDLSELKDDGGGVVNLVVPESTASLVPVSSVPLYWQRSPSSTASSSNRVFSHTLDEAHVATISHLLAHYELSCTVNEKCVRRLEWSNIVKKMVVSYRDVGMSTTSRTDPRITSGGALCAAMNAILRSLCLPVSHRVETEIEFFRRTPKYTDEILATLDAADRTERNSAILDLYQARCAFEDKSVKTDCRNCRQLELTLNSNETNVNMRPPPDDFVQLAEQHGGEDLRRLAVVHTRDDFVFHSNPRFFARFGGGLEEGRSPICCASSSLLVCLNSTTTTTTVAATPNAVGAGYFDSDSITQSFRNEELVRVTLSDNVAVNEITATRTPLYFVVSRRKRRGYGDGLIESCFPLAQGVGEEDEEETEETNAGLVSRCLPDLIQMSSTALTDRIHRSDADLLGLVLTVRAKCLDVNSRSMVAAFVSLGGGEDERSMETTTFAPFSTHSGPTVRPSVVVMDPDHHYDAIAARLLIDVLTVWPESRYRERCERGFDNVLLQYMRENRTLCSTVVDYLLRRDGGECSTTTGVVGDKKLAARCRKLVDANYVSRVLYAMALAHICSQNRMLLQTVEGESGRICPSCEVEETEDCSECISTFSTRPFAEWSAVIDQLMRRKLDQRKKRKERRRRRQQQQNNGFHLWLPTPHDIINSACKSLNAILLSRRNDELKLNHGEGNNSRKRRRGYTSASLLDIQRVGKRVRRRVAAPPAEENDEEDEEEEDTDNKTAGLFVQGLNMAVTYSSRDGTDILYRYHSGRFSDCSKRNQQHRSSSSTLLLSVCDYVADTRSWVETGLQFRTDASVLAALEHFAIKSEGMYDPLAAENLLAGAILSTTTTTQMPTTRTALAIARDVVQKAREAADGKRRGACSACGEDNIQLDVLTPLHDKYHTGEHEKKRCECIYCEECVVNYVKTRTARVLVDGLRGVSILASLPALTVCPEGRETVDLSSIAQVIDRRRNALSRVECMVWDSLVSPALPISDITEKHLLCISCLKIGVPSVDGNWTSPSSSSSSAAAANCERSCVETARVQEVEFELARTLKVDFEERISSSSPSPSSLARYRLWFELNVRPLINVDLVLKTTRPIHRICSPHWLDSWIPLTPHYIGDARIPKAAIEFDKEMRACLDKRVDANVSAVNSAANELPQPPTAPTSARVTDSPLHQVEKLVKRSVEYALGSLDVKNECPGCSTVIEKSSGCMLMECPICHTTFCLLCRETIAPAEQDPRRSVINGITLDHYRHHLEVHNMNYAFEPTSSPGSCLMSLHTFKRTDLEAIFSRFDSSLCDTNISSISSSSSSIAGNLELYLMSEGFEYIDNMCVRGK